MEMVSFSPGFILLVFLLVGPTIAKVYPIADREPPHDPHDHDSSSEKCDNPEKHCGENQVYSLGSSCEKSCKDLNPICHYDLRTMCRCLPGFIRHHKGQDAKCIPLIDCPRPKPSCGFNEEPTDCRTTCEQSCEQPLPRICLKNCAEGLCQCKKGLVRHPNGTCVQYKQCPRLKPSCGANEEPTDCRTTCEQSCEHPLPRICPVKCAVGLCQCKKGFVRHPNGTCVQYKQCPRPKPTCGPHEQFKECGMDCEPSCDYPKPKVCPYGGICIPDVCECVDGYVRHPNGKCVPQSYCPKTCSENEKYQEHGGICERSCDHPDEVPKTCSNPFFDVSGCFCADGFVRDKKSGKCVRPRQCPPPKCPENERYQEHGALCEPNCDYPDKAVRCNSSADASRCICADGFVRDKKSGKCVRRDQCPKTCAENEMYQEHGGICERSCDHPDEVPKTCFNFIDAFGCFCAPGFVRDKKRKKCVSPSQCSHPKCGNNEVFTMDGTKPSCEPSCVDPWNKCWDVREGCMCKRGFVRDHENKCIPLADCSNSLVKTGDDKFQKCCRDNGLTEGWALGLCNYTATIEISKMMADYFAPKKNTQDRSSNAIDVKVTVLKCFTAGKDVTQCCHKHGVGNDCLPLCKSAFYMLPETLRPETLVKCFGDDVAHQENVLRRVFGIAQIGVQCFAEAKARGD